MARRRPDRRGRRFCPGGRKPHARRRWRHHSVRLGAPSMKRAASAVLPARPRIRVVGLYPASRSKRPRVTPSRARVGSVSRESNRAHARGRRRDDAGARSPRAPEIRAAPFWRALPLGSPRS